MEWVETTGRTVEEAKEAALDELGVDERDAEFEVLEEPRSGLFGRLRAEARVRARVRPTVPRAKEERRDRRGRGRAGSGAGDGRGENESRPAPAAAGRGGGEPRRPAGEGRGGGDSRTRSQPAPRAPQASREPRGGNDVEETVSVEEQGRLAREFVEGFVRRFGVDASVDLNTVDDETVEVSITGRDLGLLIGPGGQTLNSIQELTRTVAQRKIGGRHARIIVDVAGYRQRRKEALERFTRQVAEEVRTSGERRALEPMNPADRKVVHDTANTIDGVRTTSEGEEPRRRVVLLPDDSD